MFKHLRNKFLILNISIISIVMIAAFTTIYLTTYKSILSENKQKLESQGITQGEKTTIDNSETLEDTEGLNSGKRKSVIVRQISPVDSPSFSIKVTENGEVESILSFLQMPDKAYQKAAELAWKERENYSVIEVEGKEWMYSIKPVEKFQITRNNEEAYFSRKSTDNYQIIFLDVTDANQTLFSLFTTLLVVGFIMLIVILAISFYFANRAIQPIAKAWEKQKQFIADASHELKTPLTIINSNCGVLLANREETIESQIKWIDNIGTGTDRMSKLINDLLELAKIDGLDKEMQIETFDMSKVVWKIINSMEAAILEKDISLSTLVEPDVTVNGDYDKVARVVLVLLENAVKYTDSPGFIEIALTKSKHRVHYSVKNSGKGIPQDDLTKVFDRFYRADPSRTGEEGGYGLGLSIAKTIADGLGGKLSVSSVENEYTTFTFTFRGIH